MPPSPRKCCGKNVRFTPRNIVANCALSHLAFIVSPENRGNQCVRPAIIANTAPMDKT
jgi:hypothetical protein